MVQFKQFSSGKPKSVEGRKTKNGDDENNDMIAKILKDN
jgi:hypothetical protein